MNNRTFKELEEAIQILIKNKEECVPFGFDGDNKANTSFKITTLEKYLNKLRLGIDVDLLDFIDSLPFTDENGHGNIKDDIHAYLSLDCEIEDILYPLACQWKNL